MTVRPPTPHTSGARPPALPIVWSQTGITTR